MAVMYRQFKEQYLDILYASHKYPTRPLELERERFGFTHTQLGGRLAQQWRFSQNIEGLIRYHHHFAEVDWTDMPHPFKVSLAVTSLSDKYCDYLGIGCEEDTAAEFQSPIGSKEAAFFGPGGRRPDASGGRNSGRLYRRERHFPGTDSPSKSGSRLRRP